MKVVFQILLLLTGLALAAGENPVGREPVFTQDGKKVLYHVPDANGSSSLYLWDLQSNKTTNLNIEGTSVFRLSDGRIFYRTIGLFAELYELNMDTMQGGQVALEPSIGGKPMELSPEKVIYPSGFDDPPELFVWNSKNGKVELEKSLPRELQAISPDGKWMVLTTKADGMPNIKIVERATGKVVHETRQRELRGCYGAVFSPDNRYLAYLETGMQPLSDIVLFDLRTLKRIKLTTDGRDNRDPAFSPDGKRMVHGILKDNIYCLKVVELP